MLRPRSASQRAAHARDLRETAEEGEGDGAAPPAVEQNTHSGISGQPRALLPKKYCDRASLNAGGHADNPLTFADLARRSRGEELAR